MGGLQGRGEAKRKPSPDRRVLKLTLSYDGTDFDGWQIQPNRRTVQGILQAVACQIAGEPVVVVGSGRTDAGVHALGQVASFETTSRRSCEVFHRALNAELPEDIAILTVTEAPGGFHAIRSAKRKRYRYVIHDGGVRDVLWRRYCWPLAYSLDDLAMRSAALLLVGKHDFSSFQNSGAQRESTVRNVFTLDISRPDPNRPFEIHLEVEADGFLYNMVRAIAGTLVEVGRGVQGGAWVADVLAAHDRARAGPTAPAKGLHLLWVTYD